MKLKKLLTKSLLVAGMLTGATSAWAVEVTETYDFLTFVNGGVTLAGVTLGEEAHAHAKSGVKVRVVSNPTNNASTTLNLNGRIAVDVTRTGSASGFAWRNGSNNAYQNGLVGQWQSVSPTSGYYGLSILDLKADDEVTVTWVKRSDKSADVKFATTNAKLKSSGAAVAVDAIMTSGAAYVITADGPLDLYTSDNNFAIHSIVIVTTGTEGIDAAPMISITGANYGDRTITITGSDTNAGNVTKTYYTKDGSTPTSASTLYSAPFTITTADADGEGNVTIKAITYKDGDTSVASEVSTQVVAVGTTLPLAAITSKITNMATTAGTAYPVYTFANNNSGVAGAPVSALSATFTPVGGSASAATLSANAYTFTEAGTLTVTAHADGYSDVNTTVTVSNGYNEDRTLDFAGCADKDAVLALVSLAGDDKWNFNAGQGIYNNNSGGRDVTLKIANEGEIALYYYYNNATPQAAIVYSGGIAWNMPRYNTLEKIVVYSVATVSATIPTSTYGTIASAYALDCSALPSGVKAYKVSALSASAATLEEVTTAVAPGTGLILSGAAGTYSIPVVATGTDISATNKLQAAVTATAIDANTAYILQGGLFHLVNAASTVPAGKAYLLASDIAGGARSLDFVFAGEETTAISEECIVKSEEFATAPVYNLNGQRVEKATKGLYIVNGKKVVVK